ncbi:MAG: hypothetical protein L3K19_02720 [Thermoplasmata archaeon]|nr:hypothetical protein [Thermoplasmata archaeon]
MSRGFLRPRDFHLLKSRAALLERPRTDFDGVRRSSARPGRRSLVAALIVLSVLTPAMIAGSIGARPALTRTGSALVGFDHPATRAPVAENLSLTLPNPSTAGPNGTRVNVTGSVGDVLTVTTYVSLDSYTAAWGLVTVHIPGLSVRFPTTGGSDPQFPLTVPPKNLTFASNASLNYQSSLTLNVTAPFHLGLNATMTSSGYAPFFTLPWGTVALNFSWSYILNSSAHAVRASMGPSVLQSIFPAETFTVTYAGPSSVALGTQFTVCLSGPVTNRTFGLRGVDSTGGVFANITQPFGPDSTGCMSMPVPSNASVGKVTVQLWEYSFEPIRLRPLPATTVSVAVGRLAGTIQPSNISVLLVVDGLAVGSTLNGSYSVGLTAAPNAVHRWFFNATGYWPQASTVTVVAGSTIWLNLTLLPRNQQPTGFGSAPLINLTPIQAAALGGAILLVAGLGLYAVVQRRRPPTRPPTGTPP